MPNQKRPFHIFDRSNLQTVSIAVILLLVVALLWHGNATSFQAMGALMAQVRFEGEYRIADGPWQEIVEGEHIPSTKGDVVLRGNFHMLTPDGEYVGLYTGDIPIALYTDHISLTIREGDKESHILDTENPLYGASACGVCWNAYAVSGEDTDPIEILIHNPHRFGNETAIDELLSSTSLWANIDFEKGVLKSGEAQRTLGLFLTIVSLALLGIALFSTLIHINNNKLIWLLGLVVLFAGTYLIYEAKGVAFWSDSVVTNTTVLGSAMLCYMLFLSMAIVSFLRSAKIVGIITVGCLGVADALMLALPMITAVHFYDTWPYWVVIQLIVNVVLLICLLKDCFGPQRQSTWFYVGTILLLMAFAVDAAMTALGVWQGGVASQYAFLVLFAVVMVLVLRVIPRGINAAAKARELELQRSRLEAEKNVVEVELKESRIALMLSQIQPHFIYNTLGTIERMCLKDPEKAFHLVRNFSLYLRGNFSELDSVTPIRFSDELKHVEYYVNIEKVRFPDMSIEYEVEATDFVLPALSVQPLVENAIKHGLMRLESGGTVVIRSYETPTHFCVKVQDNGAGFDTEAPLDKKKHVGLRNIRGRLKAMVNGELILESKVGVGTTAVIMIPKEVIQ